MTDKTTPPPPLSAEALRAWRQGMGWTQAEAATRLGIARRTYQNYEEGAQDPPGPVVLACKWLMYEPRLEALRGDLRAWPGPIAG